MNQRERIRENIHQKRAAYTRKRDAQKARKLARRARTVQQFSYFRRLLARMQSQRPAHRQPRPATRPVPERDRGGVLKRLRQAFTNRTKRV
jgi:hypothetical protein